MARDKNKSTDILVGAVAVFAVIGIAFLLIVYGFDSGVPTTGIPPNGVERHRIDTIHSLPLIEIKSDTVIHSSDTIADPIIK